MTLRSLLACTAMALILSVTAPSIAADAAPTPADTLWNGIYPFIDYSTGGSIDGMIRAAETNVKTAQEDTIVVPGHGHPVSNRRELIGYRDMLVAIRGKVADLKSKGLSLEEATKRKPTKEFDAVWGKFVIGPDFFTKLVYMGV